VYEEYEYLLKSIRDKNYNKILKNLPGVLSKNAVGLEVGSALGWFLQKCEDIGYSMLGIEPIKCNYEKSIDEEGSTIINGYFPECLPIEKYANQFDFIVFNDVFEHIPETKKILTVCRKLLKEDGLLIINLPINTGVIFKAASLLKFAGSNKPMIRLWQFETESPHLHYFSSKSLRIITKETGFFTLHEFSLDTVDTDFKNTYKRIMGIGNNTRLYALVIALIVFLGTPLWKILPKDTKCLIFKKESCR
jgi:2-polyprenyl-3-methyl-5-hydroxy-6-metoxy-1,4-benzoquinol methylase